MLSAEAKKQAKRERKERNALTRNVRANERSSSCLVEMYMMMEGVAIVVTIGAAYAWSPKALINASGPAIGLVGACGVSGEKKQTAPENWERFAKLTLASGVAGAICLCLLTWWVMAVMFPEKGTEEASHHRTTGRSVASNFLIIFLFYCAMGVVLRFYARNAAQSYAETAAENAEGRAVVEQSLAHQRAVDRGVELPRMRNPYGAPDAPPQTAPPIPTPPRSWGHVNDPLQLVPDPQAYSAFPGQPAAQPPQYLPSAGQQWQYAAPTGPMSQGQPTASQPTYNWPTYPPPTGQQPQLATSGNMPSQGPWQYNQGPASTPFS